MGLRLTRSRRRALRSLWQAGDAGLASVMSFGLELLIENQLAERYTDRSRYFQDRVRLTWKGRKFGDFLFTKEI